MTAKNTHQKRKPNLTDPNDLIGSKFGHLTVKEYAGRVWKANIRAWKCVCECVCECGKEVVESYGNLQKRTNPSCGCKRKKEGALERQPLYRTWMGLRIRSEMVDSWKNSFAQFVSDLSPKPSSDHQLSRIDWKQPLGPNNYQWKTRKEVQRNRKDTYRITADGKSLCLAEWAEILGCSKWTIQARILSGWSPELAVTTPLISKSKNKDKSNDQ